MSRQSRETLERTIIGPRLVAVLASVVLLASLLTVRSAAAASGSCGDATAAPTALSMHGMRTSVLCLMNRVRTHYGLEPLSYNRDLRLAASAHSVSMVVHDYFAHEGPGGSVDSRVSRSGYLVRSGRFRVGENIAAGDGRSGSPWVIFKDWMHSPPHRANILDPSFRDAGVGVARGYPFGAGAGAATYTVDFGSRGH